jgi:hypothetical protein
MRRRGISGWWVVAALAFAVAIHAWAIRDMTPTQKRAWLNAATWGSCAEYERLKSKE